MSTVPKVVRCFVFCLIGFAAAWCGAVAGAQTTLSEPLGATSAVQTVTLTMTAAGTSASTLGAAVNVLTGGAANLDFQYVSSTCLANNAYSVGDSCSVSYTFTPTQPGVRLGGVTLVDGSGNPLGAAYVAAKGVGPRPIYYSAVSGRKVGASSIYPVGGLAVDGAGDVYVVEGTQIVEIVAVNGAIPDNATTRFVYQDANGFNIFAIAVDGLGNVYASDSSFANDVQLGSVFELVAVNGVIPSSPTARVLSSSNPFQTVNGLAVDVSGNLYAVTTQGGYVLELKTVNGVIPAGATTLQVANSNLNSTEQAIAVDGSGNVFVSTPGNNLSGVTEFGASGSFGTFGTGSRSNSTTGLQPDGLAVDGANNLYFISKQSTLSALGEYLAVNGVLSTSGTLVLPGAGVSSPSAIAVGGNGKIYVGSGALVNEYDRSALPGLTFEATQYGQLSADSPMGLQILNEGNATLNATVPSSGSNPALTSSYLLDGGSTCPTAGGSVTTLGSAATCVIDIDFKPTTGGPSPGTPVTGSYVLTDDALPTTQTIALTGTAIAPVPTVTGVSPSAGPAAGGSNVTISGTNLDQTTGVNFGGVAATSVAIASATQVTALSPAGSAGTTVDVVVSSYGQTTATSAADKFSYQGTSKTTPTITWATPAAITYGTALSATQLNATTSVAGSFVYTPGSGTVLGAGSQTLKVVFTPTDTTSYTTASAQVTLQVNQATPMVTWATPVAISYGTALSATQLNATASVAGSFVYTPGSGTVLGAGSQTLKVVFTPTDTTDYARASSQVTLQVNQATPMVTWATPAAISYGTALSATQLDATASVAGSFVYTPGSGTVPAAGPQTLKVVFTPTDTTDYTTASAQVTLQVNTNGVTITWATPGAITYGTALSATQLNATTSVAGSFVYTPGAGTVLGVGSQTLKVVFTPTDTTDYSTTSAQVTLQVNQAMPTVTWATPAAISYGTALSATQLNATASAAGSFAYSPGSGTVLGVGAQTLKVVFTPTDATDYATVTKQVTLQVNQATPMLSWATPAAINYGTALSATQLNATAPVGGSFVYTPGSGTVLSAGSQTLKVVFTPTDTTDYATASAQVTLQVNTGGVTITWATPAAITYGTALSSTQLNATSSVGGTFVYTPASGAVLGVGQQTLKAVFTPTDTTNYATTSAQVSLQVNQAAPVVTWSNPSAIPYGTALSATQLNATASVGGAFVYTPASGAVLGVGPQTLKVVFTPTDTTNYSTISAQVTLQVNQVTPSVTWNTPAAIVYGTALSATQLNATSPVAGSFVYTPGVGTSLSAGPQTLKVVFTPTDTTNYATASAQVTLQVNTAAPTVTWSTPAAITYGTKLSVTQLNATSPVAGSFVYTPASGTTPGVGSQTLKVVFTPTDTTDYSATSAQVTLQVNQASAGVTWASPSAIVYGTALSATQLNATSSVPGNYVYTPGLGTVLGAGSQTLKVVFTPTDSTDYSTTSAQVTLQVNAAAPTVTWAAPAAITYGTALNATQLNATSPVAGSFIYTPASGAVLDAGSQTLKVAFTPTDTTDYVSASAQVALQVSQATPTLSFTPIPQHTYGDAPFAISASSASTGAVTYSVTGGAANVGTSSGLVTLSGAGQVKLAASQAATTDYIATTGSAAITVLQQASVTSFGLSATSITPLQTVTLTASVAPTIAGSATPTQTVTFLDGSTSPATVLGSAVMLNGGVTQLSGVTLASGTHTLYAVYSGDANYLSSASSTNATTTVTVAAEDLTFTVSGPASQTVIPGSSVVFSFQMTPLYDKYPGPVTFTVTGLPAGATYAVTPNSVATAGGPQTVTVTIQTPAAVAMNHLRSGAPWALALLMPAFLLRRRSRKRLVSLLPFGLLIVLGSIGITGCGSSNNGFFGQAAKSYAITVTAASGTVTHSVAATLQVQ